MIADGDAMQLQLREPSALARTAIRLKSVVPPPMSQHEHEVARRTCSACAPARRPLGVRDPRVERRLRLFEQRHVAEPAATAASSVSSRATSSNDAGTVSTTWQSSERCVDALALECLPQRRCACAQR